MKRFGLIGERLGHSYSKQLHGFLGDYEYGLWEIAPDKLDAFMREGAFDGINVTIPYKQAVLPYLAEMGDTARRVGCVNTIVRREDGSLYGDNTDAYGFSVMAKRAGIDFCDQKTLVLGSGGTSLTACAVIRAAGGTPIVISRKGENTYDDLEKHADAAYVVNTTPVGMYPNTDAAPLDLRRLPRLQGVLDVIYNPLRTRLLQQAQEMGIPCAGGLSMLTYQAVRACELFTGAPVSAERAKSAERALRQQAMNIVLVGMPGCGKSTLGAQLAERLHMPCVDLDAEIERACGMPIPQIFEQEGEAGFRAHEAEQLARFAKERGQVLLTGGGAVKAEENRIRLRQNGFVIHLMRERGQLPLNGRPLSQSREAVEKLWAERAPLYAACADVAIQNDQTPSACVDAMEEAYHEALCDQRT